MSKRTILPYFLLLLATACLDRLNFDFKNPANQGIAISGFISNQPGPYEIKITTVFDIDSKESTRMEVSVKSLTVSDNFGNSELLSEVNPGIYRTAASGIRGVVGGIYKIRVELYDGGVFESQPDTLLAGTLLDSMYVSFNEHYNEVKNKIYEADVLFNASLNNEKNNRVMWKFKGTFQAETHAEVPTLKCYYLDEINKCNYVPACSGYRNIGTTSKPFLVQKYPCTCCVCWYDLYSEEPILSDELFSNSSKLTGVKVYSVPLNEWTLWHKIRVEVAQRTLTRQTFAFFKALRDQKSATGDLFQPISGRIPNHFIQISGPPSPVMGIFFAASVSSKIKYIQHFGPSKGIVLPPDITYAISLEEPFANDDCRLRFPNATNLKPSFWED